MFSASSILGTGYQVMAAGQDGVAARLETRARNLANVHTAGYQAETVNFEGALKAEQHRLESEGGSAALDDTLLGASALAPTLAPGGHPDGKADGNTVDSVAETTGAKNDALKLRILNQQIDKTIQEASKVFSTMRTG